MPTGPGEACSSTLVASRRLYASFVIHLGFVCIVVGVTGSSLGSRRHEVVMKQGEVVAVGWPLDSFPAADRTRAA